MTSDPGESFSFPLSTGSGRVTVFLLLLGCVTEPPSTGLEARVVALEEELAAAKSRLSEAETALAECVTVEEADVSAETARVYGAGMAALAICQVEESNSSTDPRLIPDGSTGEETCLGDVLYPDTIAGCSSVHILYSYDDMASATEGARSFPCSEVLEYGSNEALIGAWACCNR